MTTTMKAAVFVAPGRIELADKPIPDVGPNDALVRITTTTICGTDVHILILAIECSGIMDAKKLSKQILVADLGWIKLH